MNNSLTELALDYFEHIAKWFPVMCASDEFHFLPRAEQASQYYDRLENFDGDRVDHCIAELRKFQNQCHRMAARENDLGRLTDLELLSANISGILIELTINESWRHNPLFYLKIAFIGLDHALTKPASGPEERIERVVARLRAIPQLLQQAKDNMDSVPQTYHEAALAMVIDCENYVGEIGERYVDGLGRLPAEELQQTRSALNAFGKYLDTLSPVPDQRLGLTALEATLEEHFQSIRSLAEIYEIAEEEWQENLAKLKELQAKIDPNKSWTALYHAHSPADVEKMDMISLYRREIERLGRFFREHGFGDINLSAPPELCETPTYLRSVRSSASFSAAFSTDIREKNFFYITTQLAGQRGEATANLVQKRLHREYKFLSAHETYPGHHLLDTVRRRLVNPVRRQIESPLFYEGWAYYAESLLAEYGYVDSLMDHLIDRKRRLWRAARCKIDVGLTTGILNREDAVELVTSGGFSLQEANYQIDHFQLNPGYQLCYSLGRYEIMQLRETYAGRIGLDRFHRQLLEGGELPFHLIEKRLKAAISNSL